LVFNAGVLAVAGVIAAQVFPTVVELQAINKAVNKAAIEGTTVAECRMIFEKASAIDDIKSLAAKDLVVTKESDKIVVSFEYQREIHLTGPAFLTLKYAGRSK
jgi:hypothetical protein